jgi:hypothetical protein
MNTYWDANNNAITDNDDNHDANEAYKSISFY